MGANQFAARNRLTGLVVGGTALGLSIFTYLYVESQRGPGYDSADTLPPSAGIRGQYINTGSKDVGPDTSHHNPYVRYRQEQKRLKDQED